jgi:hypothetical protein
MDDRIDHLGFTGTRSGGTDAQMKGVRRLIGKLWPRHVHHGDCIGGDAQFHRICRELHVPNIIVHPPSRTEYRAYCHGDVERKPKSYLRRNKDIVTESEWLIVCPRTADEQLRSGTWATYRYAKSLAKNIIVIDPDGKRHTYQYVELERRRPR